MFLVWRAAAAACKSDRAALEFCQARAREAQKCEIAARFHRLWHAHCAFQHWRLHTLAAVQERAEAARAAQQAAGEAAALEARLEIAAHFRVQFLMHATVAAWHRAARALSEEREAAAQHALAQERIEAALGRVRARQGALMRNHSRSQAKMCAPLQQPQPRAKTASSPSTAAEVATSTADVDHRRELARCASAAPEPLAGCAPAPSPRRPSTALDVAQDGSSATDVARPLRCNEANGRRLDDAAASNAQDATAVRVLAASELQAGFDEALASHATPFGDNLESASVCRSQRLSSMPQVAPADPTSAPVRRSGSVSCTSGTGGLNALVATAVEAQEPAADASWEAYSAFLQAAVLPDAACGLSRSGAAIVTALPLAPASDGRLRDVLAVVVPDAARLERLNLACGARRTVTMVNRSTFATSAARRCGRDRPPRVKTCTW